MYLCVSTRPENKHEKLNMKYKSVSTYGMMASTKETHYIRHESNIHNVTGLPQHILFPFIQEFFEQSEVHFSKANILQEPLNFFTHNLLFNII